MAFRKYLSASVLLLVLVCLPFFKGGESAFGLLLIHTFVLFLAGSALWDSQAIAVPRWILYLLPFFASVLLSSVVALYKYAAVLQLWDFAVAGIFAISVCTTFRRLQDTQLSFLRLAFLSISGASVISLLVNAFHGDRLSGTFVNPNDFASFLLLVVLFGLALFEQESSAVRKRVLLILVLLFSIFMFATLSRSIFLAALVVFTIFLWKKRPGKAILAAIVIMLLTGSILLIVRFSHYSDPYRYYRFKIWSNTVKSLALNPYFGIGPGMLRYFAGKVTFPAEVEVGRYARLALSADNQYIQILVESGFVGFLFFLAGWLVLLNILRKLDKRFLAYALTFTGISIVGFFSLPLNCTSVLFLFILLILVPISLEPAQSIELPLTIFRKTLGSLALILLFVFLVFFPYAAEYEFQSVTTSRDFQEAQKHLNLAVQLNPYQPYYRFRFLKPMIESHPELPATTWMNVLKTLNQCIALNPTEPDFFVARAKVYIILYQNTQDATYASQAIASYQAALSFAPNNAFLIGELADFEKHAGHYALAVTQAEQMIKLEPSFVNAYYLLAEVRFLSGDHDGAQVAFLNGEKTEKKYANYHLDKSEKYGQSLLAVNAAYKAKVKQLIFAND